MSALELVAGCVERNDEHRASRLHLADLVHEEQFVLWVQRNWLNGTSRWARLWAGICGYLGETDSTEAMRAFGDIMLCLKYNGRRPFSPGAPGCPVTPDELALLTLVAADQHKDLPLSDGLVDWLVRPASQSVLSISVRRFALVLQNHGLVLPSRVGSTQADLGSVG